MAEEQKPPRKTFDEECVEGMKLAAQRLLVSYPETRACICVWDYGRGLNDTEALNGFWLTADGPPKSPDALVNGLSQALRMVERMFMHTVSATQQMTKSTVEVVQELAARSNEYDELQEKIEEARATLANLDRQIGDRRGTSKGNTEEGQAPAAG